MSNIKTRLQNARSKFLRRNSATSTGARSIASSAGSERHAPPPLSSPLRKSVSLQKLPEAAAAADAAAAAGADAEAAREAAGEGKGEGEGGHTLRCAVLGKATESPADEAEGSTGSLNTRRSTPTSTSTSTQALAHAHAHARKPSPAVPVVCPQVTLEAPTPVHAVAVPPAELDRRALPASLSSSTTSTAPSHADHRQHHRQHHHPHHHTTPPPRPADSTAPSASPSPPPAPAPVRPQSVVHKSDADIISSLLVPDIPPPAAPAAPATAPPTVSDALGAPPAHFNADMLHRKIWVKRPHASATLVQIREDDLVDDVRDVILKKYANSLGRSFDSPDVTLHIVPRDGQRGAERILGPEEDMCRTIDAYFPGGQTVDEALIIDVPQRRTPKPSPRVPTYYHHEDGIHQQTEYFPPMPAMAHSPAALGSGQPPPLPPLQQDNRIPLPRPPHSMSVLTTGQLPTVPSPGGTRRGAGHAHRPKYTRTHTASPTTLGGGIPSSATSARPPNRPRHDSSASEAKNSAASNNPIPTPPAPVEVAPHPAALQSPTPPTPRISSPQPRKKSGKPRKPPVEAPTLPAGLLDGSVPPINVLIVEDNIINLRVLGAFMQRLKVRWQRAMNGKEAVTKWKAGGFHLVLMDIQLPVMNGLEATKEIRRLERVNGIGVFSSGSSEAPNNRLGQDGKGQDELIEDDKLGDKSMFKSPVIIVALTASSLQSDRHEALAAGCNDFLTKVSCPVSLLCKACTNASSSL